MKDEAKKTYKLSETALVNKRRYTKEWQKKHNKTICIQMSDVNDQDIIDFLKTIKNRNKYLKDLLRSQIAK